MISKLNITITVAILVIFIFGVGFLNINNISSISDFSNTIDSKDENGREGNTKNKSQSTSNDTDGDNVTDYIEKEKLGTDPAKSDTDGDGLDDGKEYNKYNTNPTKSDTDGDGLDDGKEVEIGTSPTDKDTDSDGLSDKVEVIKYDSDPNSKYTIENGLNDSEQVSYGLRPTKNPRLSEVSNDIKSVRIEKLPKGSLDAEDSDNDGYSNSLEEKVSELNRNKKDVVVEITWVENTDPKLAPLINVRESYLNSPVDNGNGINMIFHLSGEVEASSRIYGGYLNNYYEDKYHSTTSHYVLFTENVSKGGREINGISSVKNPAIALASNKKERLTGWAFMHEMGHSLGVLKSTYKGVDKNNDINSYPSVMNYKSLGSCLGNLSYCYQYSSGVGNDDWKVIEDKLESGSVVPNKNYNPKT